MPFSRQLYQLQSRLALTGPETAAILTLAGLLALGVGVRQLQARSAPPAANLAAVDARWAAADTAPAPPAVEPVFETRIVPSDSVTIPTSGFADPPPSRSRSSAESPVRMNLNTADAALLQRLPRIGPALAGRIIAYRQEHGPFRRVEDVVNVKGIGPKTLEQMAPYLYVE
jgi:competence ComEA-like helix-hairpin-helix protein